MLRAPRLNPKVPPPSRHRTQGPMESYRPKVFLGEELAWLLPIPAQRQEVYEMLHDYETVIVRLGHGDTAEEYALTMDGRGRYITLIPWYASGSDPDRPLPKKNPFTVRDAEAAAAHASEKGKTALEGIIEAAVRSGMPREAAEKMARQYLGIAHRR